MREIHRAVSWRLENAASEKKNFYRFMLPMVVHANAMVLDRRERLQRKKLSDHRIASFEWPFDSVRGYFTNLNAHPAYEDFRRIRAQRKSADKPLQSMDLAEGLKNYSERGQAYVDTLKNVIRVNGFDIADYAVFSDEPMRFVLGTADLQAADKLRADIEAMRKSGEIEEIIARMRLE